MLTAATMLNASAARIALGAALRSAAYAPTPAGMSSSGRNA
jgi:hypothetical protein